jgi:long-chain fatty acid transport protein
MRKLTEGIAIGIVCSGFLVSTSLFADIYHYKELLVGDRGANLAGAYSAVADDAAGAYYNPAGLVYGAKQSMVGISNATNFVYNDYQKSVDDESQLMEGWRYLINFAGYMKRVGNSVIGISYVIDDSSELHQDQEFDNDVVINRRSDDRTYKYGPSFATFLSEKLSWGVTLYAFQRQYYSQVNRLVNTGDASADWRFDNTRGDEFGLHLRTGLMYALADEWSLALVMKKTFFTHSAEEVQANDKDSSTTAVTYTTDTVNEYRKMPLEITLGWAWFPSAYTMVTSDLDYYLLNEDERVNVFNISFGVEHFLNENNAIRAGVFTNFDNREEPDSSTTNAEKIDMYGMSLGYSIFNGPTMITIGAVGGYGRGKIQSDPDNPSEIYDSIRETYSFSLAVSYNLDN